MYCYFCNESYAGLLTLYCEDCAYMKRTVALYGKEKVLKILKTTLIRSDEQIEKKENMVLKQEEENLKSQIKTRSKTKEVSTQTCNNH